MIIVNLLKLSTLTQLLNTLKNKFWIIFIYLNLISLFLNLFKDIFQLILILLFQLYHDLWG